MYVSFLSPCHCHRWTVVVDGVLMDVLLQLYKYFKRAKNETPAQPSVWQFEVGWRPLRCVDLDLWMYTDNPLRPSTSTTRGRKSVTSVSKRPRCCISSRWIP